MAAFHVPVVDISPYRAGDPAGRARVAAELDTACREVGFVQVVGHGIPDTLAHGLSAAIDAFFALPAEAKRRHHRPGLNRGYTPPKSESLSASLGITPAGMMNDFYEAYVVGSQAADFPGLDLPEDSYPANTWPDGDVPGFRPGVAAWFAAARGLSRTLLAAFTDALGLPEGYFDALTDHSIDTLKLNNYALEPGEIELDGELVGMGAHTDFGILTVLWADQVPGLQVLGPDSAWHDVQPADGALLVNLGDAMARWTGDRWLSTVHRVQPPVREGRIRRRRSAAFFFDGNFDAVVETLPTCRDGGTAYPPVTVAEHIAAKIAGFKTGDIGGLTGLRETARVLAADS